MAQKKPKKFRVPRTRNGGTMTESAFWSGIRSALRQKSRWWVPAANAKLAARRPYEGINKRRKWEYVCSSCKNSFKDDEVVIDHIVPAGTLKCADDLPGFVTRLFCEEEGFQILCKPCHDAKTLIDNRATKNKAKNL